VDDSDGRRRCGDDGRRGETAALCGVANVGGGRAGVATEGGRDYCGRQRATTVGGRAMRGAGAGSGGRRPGARGAGGTAAWAAAVR
jgi:hypothetical protein